MSRSPDCFIVMISIKRKKTKAKKKQGVCVELDSNETKTHAEDRTWEYGKYEGSQHNKQLQGMIYYPTPDHLKIRQRSVLLALRMEADESTHES